MRRVVQEPTGARVGTPRPVGVGVEQLVEVPTAVGGEFPDRVTTVGHEPPEPLRGVQAAGVAAAHRHDHDRVGVHVHCGQACRSRRRVGRTEQPLPQVARERARRGVVEHQGGRQAQPGLLGQSGADLQRGQ